MKTYDSLSKQTRQQLRRQLRRKRKALSRQQQHQASQQLERIFSQHGLLVGVRSIALYLANDGEIDPSLIMQRALRHNIACYLPVLAPNKKLWFVRYRRNDRLYPNGFGIPEPAKWKPARKSWALDLVLMPLVGFDRRGGRMGMGGGFYDRSFSWMRLQPKTSKPKLIGLAHHCQEVKSLTLEKWDIPMTYVATDKELVITKK